MKYRIFYGKLSGDYAACFKDAVSVLVKG